MIINGKEFNNNPSGLLKTMIFQGVVSDGIYNTYIYESSKEKVIELAKELKKLDPNYTSVEVYGPENYGSDRIFIEIVNI